MKRTRTTYLIKKVIASSTMRGIGRTTMKIKLGTLPVVGILAEHFPIL